MTKAELHYLNCQDENCEKAYCVDRREFTAKLSRPKGKKAREWWLACDGFDRFYTAYDSYEAAKTGRTMNPIHVSETTQHVEDPTK